MEGVCQDTGGSLRTKEQNLNNVWVIVVCVLYVLSRSKFSSPFRSFARREVNKELFVVLKKCDDVLREVPTEIFSFTFTGSV